MSLASTTVPQRSRMSKDTLTPVSDEGLEKKEKLLQLYTSQAHTIQGLSHMNPYEMWTQTRGGAADDTAA